MERCAKQAQRESRGTSLAGAITVQGQVPVGDLLGPTVLMAPRRLGRAGTSQGAGKKVVATADTWLCIWHCFHLLL